jgi:hypothetical protein
MNGQFRHPVAAKSPNRHNFSFARGRFRIVELSWPASAGNQPGRPQTIDGYGGGIDPGKIAKTGDLSIKTPSFRARLSDSGLTRAAVLLIPVAMPVVLIAPALWNGYPLLQWDTGGYLARWYEGYLVPSRSTVFGLYLHFGEASNFWINLVLQALLTCWIIQTTLRALGVKQRFMTVAISLLLILTTALPWLASMLLTDVFAGLSVLSLYLLVVHGERLSRVEKIALFLFTAFAAATHSATLGVLIGLCVLGLVARPWLRRRFALRGLMQGLLALATGAAMLVAANLALSGKLAWTPGGVGVAFGRMMQDGIVAQYLRDHCKDEQLKLCPYRDTLPATADDFLWGHSMFDTLGRFQGLNDEMGFIVTHSLLAYPLWQAEAAIAATARQLVSVATGEGSKGWIPHTYGIIERYIPSQLAPMRAAHQQHWDLDFTAINRLHVPVALLSMALVVAMVGQAILRRRLDDLGLLAATVTSALLGNAAVCAVISGPHDRYGARMVWIATFTVLVAAARAVSGDGASRPS